MVGKFRDFSLVLILFFVSILFLQIYTGKVLPNVYFANTNVSSLTEEDFAEVVTKKVNYFSSQKIQFLILNPKTGKEEILESDPSTLGIYVDEKMSFDKVFNFGHKQGLLVNFFELLSSSLMRKGFLPAYFVDAAQFSKVTANLFSKYEVEAKNSYISRDGKTQIVGEEKGLSLDKSRLANDLRDRVENLDREPIRVSMLVEEPEVGVERAVKAQMRVKELLNQKVTLKFSDQKWQLSRASLLKLIDFAPYGLEKGYVMKFDVGETPVVVTDFVADETQKRDLNVFLDSEGLDKFVFEIGESLNQDTVDATLVFEGGKVSEFTPAQDGQTLNESLTKQLILDKVSINNNNFEKEIVLNLPVEVTVAKIANDEINSLGIKELVGRGISFFAGSIPNRIHNVSLGSSRINGVLVKSGESFSFNKAVGEVSGRTGYKPAYVISSGRTVLDDGGGICQVSTTVFRAALNAGLPITSRTAHAYRVGYYEQGGFKPGLDATVWSPAVDLVFKNDSDKAVLVQTLVDLENLKLQVDIYGTRDGRKVEVSESIVSNVSSAPADKYQDDPSLPKGTVKQVDFAAPGATSVFARKVFKGDKVLIDETFKSVYRPWQAIFLVGTGG